VATPSLPVLYSTPRADAVADFVSTHYDLATPIACKLLTGGWNDSFDVRTRDAERFVFRISKQRARGEADLASETGFLAYLDRQGIAVAAAVPTRDGSLFTSVILPEGRRPAVLFRYAEGRPSQARGSVADARANGVTLARIHDAAGGFAAGDKGRYRLDRDHLLHRPLSFILAIEGLSDSVATGSIDLTGRLASAVAERDGLSWTRCHGDCYGYNAHIALQGPRAGQAVFFDFDESGPGYLAYDVAAFLWCCVIFDRKDHASWHPFIEGYRSIRELARADFEAAHLFVPIRHIWLLGEWASRTSEWGSQAVPPTGSPRSWISCCHGKSRSWRQGCFDHFRFETVLSCPPERTTVRSEGFDATARFHGACDRRRDDVAAACSCATPAKNLSHWRAASGHAGIVLVAHQGIA
jgi:Ser/Thr protein kinase RdoA (MazF antagonist)